MSHYARDCWDAEILTSYGWIECVGHADRSAYDLTQHGNATKQRITCYRGFETPIIRKIWRAKILMSEICRDPKNELREGSKLLSKYFSNFEENQVLKLRENLLELKEDETIKVVIPDNHFGDGNPESEYHLKSTMVEVFQETEKITGETYIPYVIEPSFGIGRIMYSLLEHSFHIRDDKKNDPKKITPVFLSLSPLVAPISCGVLSVITDKGKGGPVFKPHVDQIIRELSDYGIMCRDDDSSATIGRKYARFDEIGTPFVITVDSETIVSQTVTLRERDSIEQIRIPTKKITKLVSNLIHLRLSWNDLKNKFQKGL